MLWLFYPVALMMLFFAHAVILSNHPVRSVLGLIGCFLCTTVLWLLLEAEFLALALIFVYIGAVMTLFLFMVMMMNVSQYLAEDQFGWLTCACVVGLTTVLPVILFCVYTTGHFGHGFAFKQLMHPEPYPGSYLEHFSTVLYRQYFWVLQLLAMILVVPIVVAAGIVRQGKSPQTRVQKPQQQLAVNAKTRVTLVSNRQRRR